MSESSTHSPPSPHPPTSESIRRHLPNIERLTGLNCNEWLRHWRLVLAVTDNLNLTEYPLPLRPALIIAKSSRDKRNFLTDESEEIRDLMLLTIDPKFREDFESLGLYELMMTVEERFRKPVEEEQSRIFKILTDCKQKEGSSIDSHVVQIADYMSELHKLGFHMSQEESVDILLDSLTSKYDPFVRMYREGNKKRVFMEMRPLLNFYESLMDRHSSRNSAASELSPVEGHCQKRARLSGYVLSRKPLESDTVEERFEDAPKSETSKKLRYEIRRMEAHLDWIPSSCSFEV
ncbi:hypothetical protein L1887_32317 [Cichorium endivia]|nr:hypothetical protein L1887_32317 [Cichorium endivia]